MPNLDAFDGQDHSNDVVIYRAIVGVAGIERSSLWYRPEVPEDALREILMRPAPHLIHFQWPPTKTNGEAETSNTVLAMLRLKAGLDLDCGTSPTMSSSEVRSHVLRLHPLVANLRKRNGKLVRITDCARALIGTANTVLVLAPIALACLGH